MLKQVLLIQPGIMLLFSDLYGCSFKDSIQIDVLKGKCDVPYIFIPNAFTPDANINNVLYVRSTVIEKGSFCNIWTGGVKKYLNLLIFLPDGMVCIKVKNVIPVFFDYYIEATCIDNSFL